MDDQEKLQKGMALAVEIEALIIKAKELGQSRALSLVVTKLDEAALWLSKEFV